VRGGELEDNCCQRISSNAAEETVLQEVYAAIDGLFDEDVAGIGCGVPSVIDVKRGIVYNVENIPSWLEVHLGELLEQRYGVPVCVNNDANAFALGEFFFGKGRQYRDMVGVTLGTGLGTGVIINGRLYCGHSCGAGEIGMIPFREHNIEYYCAGRFFSSRGCSGESACELARQGNRKALQLFEEYGRELGHAVLTVLYAFDPELIVFGGSISQAFDLFEGGLRERLQDYAYQLGLAGKVITASETENVAILGAAAIALNARSPAGKPLKTAGGK
jgi:glucokinase